MVSNLRNKVSLIKIKQLVAELRKVYLEDNTVFGIDSFIGRLKVLIDRYKINPRDWVYFKAGRENIYKLVFDDANVVIKALESTYIKLGSISCKVEKIYIY